MNEPDNRVDITPPKGAVMGRYDEDASTREQQAEDSRLTRLETLDGLIRKRKQAFDDALIELQALEKKTETVRQTLKNEMLEHERKIASDKADLMVLQNDTKVRDSRADKREYKLLTDQKKWHEGRRQRLLDKQAETKEIATLTHTKEKLEGDILSLEERRKQADREYVAVMADYADRVAQIMNRLNNLNTTLEETHAEVEFLKKAEKAYNAKHKRVRKAWQQKEAQLVKREKEVQNKERKVHNRYRTVITAAQELRDKGAKLPEDITSSL
jgi:chromosome segregation ATPase